MTAPDSHSYKLIALAIDYIKDNFKLQPDLDAIASHVSLSPYHFQRLFTDWAGVSPKKFLQFLNVEYSKSLLKEKESTLFDVAHQTGLSGTGRLHDLFVNLEGMTPGEYKNGGEGLQINYSVCDTLFGEVLVASTLKGICKLTFIQDSENALEELKAIFPKAKYTEGIDALQKSALSIFSKDWKNVTEIKLHLKGTDFQLKVWKALLSIPSGNLSSYGKIAGIAGNKNASRAVGTAIGDNPVAFIIPCHRVVQSSGNYGEYRWGSTRKKILIGWEASKLENEIGSL